MLASECRQLLFLLVLIFLYHISFGENWGLVSFTEEQRAGNNQENEQPPHPCVKNEPAEPERRFKNVENFDKWSIYTDLVLYYTGKFTCSVHKSGSKILIDYYGLDLLDTDTG